MASLRASRFHFLKIVIGQSSCNDDDDDDDDDVDIKIVLQHSSHLSVQSSDRTFLAKKWIGENIFEKGLTKLCFFGTFESDILITFSSLG